MVPKKFFIAENQTTNSPFFYIIRCKHLDRYYAGFYSRKKLCDSSLFMTDTGYQTSSKIVKSIIRKNGLDDFEVVIIRHFDDAKAALSYEAKFLKKVDAKNNSKFLNLSNGDSKFGLTKVVLSADSRKKLSQSLRGRKWWNDGKNETCSKHQPGVHWDNGRLPKMFEHLKTHCKSSEGSSWWNDGNVSKKFHTNPGEGWVKGQIASDKMLRSNRKIGVWWTNGVVNTRSVECPGDEWTRGRTIQQSVVDSWRNSKVGKVFWNNGIDVIRANESPGEGWVRGMLCRQSSPD